MPLIPMMSKCSFHMLCFCMSEVISSFRSLRVGSQVFALLMLFLCVILHTISCPLWPSVCKCQRVECAFTSPVRTDCSMFVMYCLCDVICLVLLMCTLTI